MNNLPIKRARVEDAKAILNLQKLAYLSEAEIYNNKSIPPLTQTLEEIRAEFDNQIFLKALIDERIVGSVRAYQTEGTCHIGRLVVHPKFQNRGIGTRLMNEIETCFDKAQRFGLFTGDNSERNLYLYHKLGYREFQRKNFQENFVLVFLEKDRNQTSKQGSTNKNTVYHPQPPGDHDNGDNAHPAPLDGNKAGQSDPRCKPVKTGSIC
jgi:ribosomal protein S18 acetylase RimI-like enzyme